MGRNKTDKILLSCRVSKEVRSKLNALAITHGLSHNLNGERVPAIGALLELVFGDGFAIVPITEYRKLKSDKPVDTKTSHKDD